MQLNKPPWLLNDNKNSSEVLDYPSGFGPEGFFYDIDLDDDVFGLFDFDSTYSLDEDLATVVPLNMSLLLEMGNEATASTGSPDDVSQAVSRQDSLHNRSESSSQVINLLGLSRLNGQTAEPPSLVVPKPSSSLNSGLFDSHQDTQVTSTELSTEPSEVLSHLIMPTLVVPWRTRTLGEGYGSTMDTEAVHNFTETPSLSALASSSLGYHSIYLPFQTALFTEPQAVSHSPSQSSYSFIAEAHPTPSLPASVATKAGLLMDSSQSSGTLTEVLSSYTSTMLAAEAQSDYLMTETIRPSPLYLLTATDVSMALTPGSAESLFASGAKDSSDLVLALSKNLFVLTPNPHTNDFSYLITPSLVISALGSGGTTVTSLEASHSKLDSPQVLKPSHVNGLLETLFRGSNRQRDNNSSEADIRGLSHVSHISVNSSSESPHATAAALTDEWSSFPSSPVNSSSQMRAERRDGLPLFSSPTPSSVPISAALLDVSKWGSATELVRFPGEVVGLLTSLPPPYLSDSDFLDSERGPPVSQRVMKNISYIIGTSYQAEITPTTNTSYHSYSSKMMIQTSETSPDGANALRPHVGGSANPTPFLSASIGVIQDTRYEPMSRLTQSATGFRHLFTLPSTHWWPSGLDASAQTSAPPIHPVHTSIPTNLQDTKYAQSPTTEQPFRSENESAKPSSHSHNVLVVRPATTDRETHPSPPAIDHQSFVPSNGMLPLSAPPKGAIAGFDTVPTGATHGTTPDSLELAPCPCKARFHITCLCGLSTGNSMFSSNKVDTRERYTSFLAKSLLGALAGLRMMV